MTESEKTEFSTLWERMSDNQRKFCVARSSQYSSDAAAAKSVGISPSTCRNWGNRKEIDRVVYLMVSNQRDAAMAILESAVPRAIEVLLEVVEDPKTPRTRLAAVMDVLDRTLGRPIQRVAPVTPDGTAPYQPNIAIEQQERVLSRLEELLALGRQRRLAAEAAIEGQVRVLDDGSQETTELTESNSQKES
jgi:hypothetical protein